MSQVTRYRKDTLSETDLMYIERLAALGMNLEHIAAAAGFNPRTFARWRKDHPAIDEAIEIGRSKGIATVTGKAFEMASNGKNQIMTIFWLKSQASWKETTTIEHQKTIVFKTRIGEDGTLRNEETPLIEGEVIDADEDEYE